MNEYKGTLRKGLILVAFGVCLYSGLQNMNSLIGTVNNLLQIASPVILGLCIAFVLNVVMTSCEKLLLWPHKKAKRKPPLKLIRAIALLLTLVIAVGIITLTLVVIIPKVSEAIGMVVSVLPQSSHELSSLLGEGLKEIGFSEEAIVDLQSSIKQMSDQILGFVKDQSANIASYALNITSSLLTTVMDVVFAIIISIYVLMDKERIGRFVYAVLHRFLPEKVSFHVVRLARLSYTTFSNFVRGQLLEAVILGALCFVGTLIFRFPYAPVISLLVGVTALIPVVGAWLGGAISALLVLLVSPIKALLLIVFIVVLQQLEGDLIYPKVVGSSIGLPGLLVLSSVIVGQGLMGVPGILLCVPLSAVLFTVLKEAVYDLEKKTAPKK